MRVHIITPEYIQVMAHVPFPACSFLPLKMNHHYIFNLSCRQKNLINNLCNDFSSYGYSVFDQNMGKFFEGCFKLQMLKNRRF